MSAVFSVLRKIPFVRMALFFVLGALAVSYGFSVKYVAVLLVSGFMFFLLHYLILKQKDEIQYSYRWLFGVALAFFMFSFGMTFNYHTKMFGASETSSYYMGKVISAPQECSNASVKCMISLSKVDEAKQTKSAESFVAYVYMPRSESSANLGPGDSLLLSPQPAAIQLHDDEISLMSEPNTFFVEDGAWQVIADDNDFHASTFRDSLIGSLKKKDVITMN